MSDHALWPLALSISPSAMRRERLEALAEAGMRQAELSSGGVDPWFDALDFPHRARELVSLARGAGVTLSSIHLPFGPFSRIDPAAREAEVRETIVQIQTWLLDAAGDAGIGIAVLHPSGEPYRDEERAERLEIALDTVGKIAEAAKKAGVTLALENLPRTCLGRDAREMRFFLDALPDLRCCFDTNHSLRQDNPSFIRALGGRIVTIHASDYDFVDEKHWLPLAGQNDWPGIIAALREVGYKGRFLYELREGPTDEEIAENYHKLLG